MLAVVTSYIETGLFSEPHFDYEEDVRNPYFYTFLLKEYLASDRKV